MPARMALPPMDPPMEPLMCPPICPPIAAAGDARPTPRAIAEAMPIPVVLSMEVLLDKSAWCSTVRLADGKHVRPAALLATYIVVEIGDPAALLALA